MLECVLGNSTNSFFFLVVIDHLGMPMRADILPVLKGDFLFF